jgi:hypothetical protein
MTDGPIPRLSPYEVLQVLDQMLLEAEEATRLVVWKHSAVCDGFTAGIWEPDATCSHCHFEVGYRQHIEQYLLVPVAQPEAAEPKCTYCGGRGIVPDTSEWSNGEPAAAPCPRCSLPQPAG